MASKNYVIPKGRIYFDRYADGAVMTAGLKGEGEVYLGNTPGASTTQTAENIDHFDSDSRVKVKDESVQLSLERAGTITVDDISANNLALYMQGSLGSVAQAAAADVEEVLSVKRGRFYQIGATAGNPTGVRDISAVTVAKGVGFATNVNAAGNYTIDAELGRIFIAEGAPDIPNDTEIQVTYTIANGTREQVISGNNVIYGALRVVADNPKGENRDHYYPYVKLTPSGDYVLKADTWVSLEFSLEILKKADGVEMVYIDGRPA